MIGNGELLNGLRQIATQEASIPALRAALLRISGAIQALTELSEAGDQHDDSPTLVDVNAAGEHASSA